MLASGGYSLKWFLILLLKKHLQAGLAVKPKGAPARESASGSQSRPQKALIAPSAWGVPAGLLAQLCAENPKSKEVLAALLFHPRQILCKIIVFHRHWLLTFGLPSAASSPKLGE